MNPLAKLSLLRLPLRIAAWLACRALLLGFVLWSTLAIYYSNLPTLGLRSAAAALFACGVIALRVRIRPAWLARWLVLAACSAIVAWFLLIPPSNQRDWQPDVALLPYAEIQGNQITIHNIRNCDYRSESDYTVRHYDKSLDLDQLRSVDLFLVYWGSPLIAHTMLSFGFADGSYVCFSIETRKEKGEAYSAIKGFFRQYELTYVIGDERDLVRLRTNFRGEQVYLYRLQTDLPTARLVLLDYLKEVNRLKDQPEWYNALTSNCTTNIRGHTYPYARKSRWNWRLLANGYVDELAYSVGALDHSLAFKDLKTRSLINERAKAADPDPTFSTRIRAGLPGFPP
jgi:hypothetical protein